MCVSLTLVNQRTQNTETARTVLDTQHSHPIRHLLCHLHRLPVHPRINYKIATLTYNAPAHNQLLYLSYLLTVYTPVHTPHSQDKHLLAVPAVSTVIGRRGFSYAAPSVWNKISLKIPNSPSVVSFKQHLPHSVK